MADQMRAGVIAYLGNSVEHGDARVAGALALMVSVLSRRTRSSFSVGPGRSGSSFTSYRAPRPRRTGSPW